jgi:hypothetical protein
LAKQGPLLELVKRELKRNHRPDAPIKRLLLEQPGLAQWAEKLISDDYDPINRHDVIGLWVAVEVAVEHTAILILSKESSAAALVEAAGVRLPQLPSLPPSEADAGRIYKRLEAHTRRDRSVAEGYCELMSILGVEVTITPATSAVLAELNYVRNCLLHRAGIADERAAREAPDLGLAIGAPIKISSKRYLRYFDAVAQFAQALLKGAIGSSYLRRLP